MPWRDPSRWLHFPVVPAKAGTQRLSSHATGWPFLETSAFGQTRPKAEVSRNGQPVACDESRWVPAFAGTTGKWSHLDGSLHGIAALLHCGFAPFDIDVVIHPRMRVEGVVVVPAHPRVHDDVLDAIGVQHPGRVGDDELGHPPVELRALRA